MADSDRLLPSITPYNAPFFEAGRDGRLMVQQCPRCGKLLYYPRIACTACLSLELRWRELSGRGELYSYSMLWRPQQPGNLADVPLVLIAVKLDEGPTIISHLVNCDVNTVHIGMRVHVTFDELAPNIFLPKFEPERRTSAA